MVLIDVCWVMYWCSNKVYLKLIYIYTVNTPCLYDGIVTTAQCKD